MRRSQGLSGRGWLAYLITAAILGVLWYFVVFEIQVTGEQFLVEFGARESRNELPLVSSMVVTSCFVASGFSMAIRRMPIAALVVTAPIPMFVGAAVFIGVLAGLALGFTDADIPWNGSETQPLLAGPFIAACLAVWMAGAAWKVSVPLAIVSVLALRGVARWTVSPRIAVTPLG